MVDKIHLKDTTTGGFKISWGSYENVLNSKLEFAQKYVDGEVLRLCDPYIPEDSSNLIKSGVIATKIGSGEVIWDTSRVGGGQKYAKKMYYGNYNFRGAPIKGNHWGTRAMQNGGYKAIKKGVGEILK